MININANIFDLIEPNSIICIPTNGIVKSNGEAVMGAGLALEAKKRYPDLPRRLGGFLSKFKINKPYVLAGIKNNEYYIPEKEKLNEYCLICSFPTKDDFRDKSKISLIENSCIIIDKIVKKYSISKCFVPMVGAGLGKLDFNDVKNVLNKHFDSKYYLVSYGEK